ncbi:MAG: DUF433 domain-containing protein [Caldilineaceae bacterium]
MLQLAPRIVVDPTIRFGKPIIQGTRISVAQVLAKLAGGMTMDELMQEYELSQADIRAALHYASIKVDEEEILVHA